MKTSINGKPATWTPEIQREWDAHASQRPAGVVLDANYFTARPYVDDYNQGDMKTGFVYTLKPTFDVGLQVCGFAWYIDEEGGRIYCEPLRVMKPRPMRRPGVQ